MNLPLLSLAAALFIPSPVRAQPQQAPEVLATVDGVPIRREDVANRVWQQHASEALNQIVDELAFNKALSAWRMKQSKKDQQSVLAEVDVRLKRIKGQFKDEAA